MPARLAVIFVETNKTIWKIILSNSIDTSFSETFSTVYQNGSLDLPGQFLRTHPRQMITWLGKNVSILTLMILIYNRKISETV